MTKSKISLPKLEKFSVFTEVCSRTPWESGRVKLGWKGDISMHSKLFVTTSRNSRFSPPLSKAEFQNCRARSAHREFCFSTEVHLYMFVCSCDHLHGFERLQNQKSQYRKFRKSSIHGSMFWSHYIRAIWAFIRTFVEEVRFHILVFLASAGNVKNAYHSM